MLENLKNFFTRKDESKSENQRNSENGVDRTRFTLMAESYAAVEGDCFSVEGQLFGNTKEGEKVYALHRDGTISHLMIIKIEEIDALGEQAEQ